MGELPKLISASENSRSSGCPQLPQLPALSYQHSDLVATCVLWAHEGTADATNPDVALGNIAILLGSAFAVDPARDKDGNPQPAMSAGDLAQAIWKDVCGQATPIKLP